MTKKKARTSHNVTQILSKFSQPRILIKKTSTLRSSPNGYLTSYQVSEKSLERFLRKAVTDGRTNGRMDKAELISPFGFQPGTNNTIKKLFVLSLNIIICCQ